MYLSLKPAHSCLSSVNDAFIYLATYTNCFSITVNLSTTGALECVYRHGYCAMLGLKLQCCTIPKAILSMTILYSLRYTTRLPF